MPRPHRDATPGLHHVTVGATGSEVYYVDDVDRLVWLRRFVQTLDRYRWTCVLFVQLTTHVHVILDVPDESLPTGMHFLDFAYSRRFNERHTRRGSLLRARYWSKRIRTEAQLRRTGGYVAANPVRAGLCERAEEWRWGSFGTSCGVADAFPFVDASCLLAALGVAGAGDRRRLLELLPDE